MTPEAWTAWIDDLVTCITSDLDLDKAAAALAEFGQYAWERHPAGTQIPRGVRRLLPYTIPLGNPLGKVYPANEVPPDIAERVTQVTKRVHQNHPELWATWVKQLEWTVWAEDLIRCVTADPDLDKAAAALIELAQALTRRPHGAMLPRNLKFIAPYGTFLGGVPAPPNAPEDSDERVRTRVTALVAHLEQHYPEMWANWRQAHLHWGSDSKGIDE